MHIVNKIFRYLANGELHQCTSFRFNIGDNRIAAMANELLPVTAKLCNDSFSNLQKKRPFVSNWFDATGFKNRLITILCLVVATYT